MIKSIIKKITNSNITFINALSSVFLQIATIVSGFIIPRLILQNFGSEVNGLISSFNQFFGYITLVEGGVTSVVMARLYKPLLKRNHDEISSIVNTTKKFYNQLSLIFIIYTVLLSLFYPIIFKTSFDYSFVLALGLVLGISLFIQYNFALALRLLLESDKKLYIVAWTQILILVINTILFAVLVKIFPNIIILKLICGLFYILQPIFYNLAVRKYFKIQANAKPNDDLLQNRWNGFSISMASFIHNNADVVILTIFTNLSTVSVYSVYALVTKGLRQIINSVTRAIEPTIGRVYATNNNEELNKKFNIFEFCVYFLTFLLFVVGGLLITPFVELYTMDINDINYSVPLFGILIVMSEAVYCLQEPYNKMTYIADKFKDIKYAAYMEAAINIVLSVLLVKKYGLVGVAIGTLVAMIFRVLFQVIYLKNNVLKRKLSEFWKKIIGFGLGTIISILLCSLFKITKLTIINWIITAVIYFSICLFIFLIISYIFYKEECNYFVNKIFKKNEHQKN